MYSEDSFCLRAALILLVLGFILCAGALFPNWLGPLARFSPANTNTMTRAMTESSATEASSDPAGARRKGGRFAPNEEVIF